MVLRPQELSKSASVPQHGFESAFVSRMRYVVYPWMPRRARNVSLEEVVRGTLPSSLTSDMSETGEIRRSAPISLDGDERSDADT